MKKIIVLAFATAIGLCANAATIMWGAEVVNDGYGSEAPDGWIAYFIEAASNSDGISALQSGDLSFLGSRTAETDGGEISAAITGLGNSVTKTGYMVVFNSDDAASATYAFVTDVQSASTTALGGGGSISYDIEDDTASIANWTKIGGGSTPVTPTIPEPTSGLLMLVGLGALALRRRRA